MKRLFALLTCLVLLLTLLPLSSVSATYENTDVVVGGVFLEDGDYLAVGANAPQTTKPAGGYAHYKDGTLTLNNYTYEGNGIELTEVGWRPIEDVFALIYTDVSLTIHLIGNNSLSEKKSDGLVNGIRCIGYLTITADKDAELTLNVNYYGIKMSTYTKLNIKGGTIRIPRGEGGIYSDGLSIIMDGGELDIQTDNSGIEITVGTLIDEGPGVASPNGYFCGLIVNDGRIKVNSHMNAIDTPYVTINGGSVYAESQAHYGIFTHAAVINGGNVTVKGENDGINTLLDIAINGGTVDVTAGAVGIQTGSGSRVLSINGGVVTVRSGDHGLCAGWGDVNITGGIIHVTSGGSGICALQWTDYYSKGGNICIENADLDITSNSAGDATNSAIKTVNGTVSVNENLYQAGSYSPDGELIPYNRADNKLYDRVVICGEHIYDGVCDGECNHCGTTRTAKAHAWKNGKCAVCGKGSPTKVKITAQSATACYAKAGATVSAKVTAKGDGLKYQWYVKNAGGTKYSKSAITKATYAVSMSSKVKGRRVYCVVTDKYGNKVTSKTFILRESVSITTQPKTVAVKKNATAKVMVKAKGDGLKYQWYYKNEGKTKYSKSSVKTATYSVKMTAKAKNRLLLCIITDQYGNKVQTKTVKLKMKS